MKLIQRIRKTFMDYARCIYFESNGNPLHIPGVTARILTARIKHDHGPFNYSMFSFRNVPRTQWSTYISNKEFWRLIENRYHPDSYKPVRNKALFYEHCLEHGLPTIPIVCIVGRSKQPLSTKNITQIQDFDQWQQTLESAPADLFAKPIDGSKGAGAFSISHIGEQYSYGRLLIKGSIRNLYSYVLEKSRNAVLIVQPRIRSHPDILEFSSVHGLTTTRVVTAMVNGEPQVLYACVRLPVGANITDNFADASSGNLIAAINLETGTLGNAFRSARSDWPVIHCIEAHPDTGHRIRGSVFPMWQSVINLALRAQNSLPSLGTMGCDIAVSKKGPLLVETNNTYGVDMLQTAHQQGFSRELTSIVKDQTL